MVSPDFTQISKSLQPVIQEATRYHESVHKYHQFGFLPWNTIGREIDAYTKELLWLRAKRYEAAKKRDQKTVDEIDNEIKLVVAMLKDLRKSQKCKKKE